MERVIVTKPCVGICHMQVCAESDASDEEILSVCNSQNESGTMNGWGEVIREGKGAPVQCADHPDRTHFLVCC